MRMRNGTSCQTVSLFKTLNWLNFSRKWSWWSWQRNQNHQTN